MKLIESGGVKAGRVLRMVDSGLRISMVYGFIKQSNGHVAIYSESDLARRCTGWELAERARKQRPHLKVPLTSGYTLETLWPSMAGGHRTR